MRHHPFTSPLFFGAPLRGRSLRILALLGMVLPLGCGKSTEQAPATPAPPVSSPPIARDVEIRRTSYGVPHILGESLEAGAFGLAWVMMEDYGEVVPQQLLTSNGRWATTQGHGAVEGDFAGRMAHDYAVQVFPGFPSDVQAILRGFAAGVNYFIEVHRDALPEWAEPEFTAEDVAARDLRVWDAGAVRNFLRSRGTSGDEGVESSRSEEEVDPDAGSNAWAFGPTRTASGNAILVRNPHLSYTSGYYEAHFTVRGKLNFYGDFRLGGPFTIIGGFNDRLGWSTTNNYGNPNQVYALLKAPGHSDTYQWGGATESIETRSVTAEYLDADSMASISREFRFTPLGPVLFETPDTVFVLKTPALGQHRLGEQWLKMMQAGSLEEWKDAMRIRAKYSSNFTYADADGNIFYVWNASLPLLPHEPSDGAPVFASGPDDVWSEIYPWDELPQLLNPQGGYVQNANDPPYFTNLNEIMDPEDFPPNFPEPRLRFRSQNSLELVHNDRVLSLEDVVELKHSMKMMLADRVKDDLVRTVRAGNPAKEVTEAIDLVEAWDNRVARDSRGAALFELWAGRYTSRVADTLQFREPWSVDSPATTPHGIGDEEFAILAFDWAVEEANRRWGAWDVTWGDVHRIRAGDLDIPVGGCPSGLGCFRVIGFAQDPDERYRARTGDAWVLAVEFAETPRAYSILVYGNSNREDSPYFYDQAEMFANNHMKPVAYSEADILADLVERYHPGEVRHR